MSEIRIMEMELDPAEYTIHGSGYRCWWVAEIQGCRIGITNSVPYSYADAPSNIDHPLVGRWLIKVPVQSTLVKNIWGWNFLGGDQALVMSIVDATQHRSREEAEQELALYLLKRSAQ